MVCAYTKLGWQRTKGVYEFREDEGWDYTKSSDIGNESQVRNDDQRLMDYTKSSDWELSMVIEPHE